MIMSIEEKIDQAKGAAKEGVGKLTDDKKQKKKGLRRKRLQKLKKLLKMLKMLQKEQLTVSKIL